MATTRAPARGPATVAREDMVPGAGARAGATRDTAHGSSSLATARRAHGPGEAHDDAGVPADEPTRRPRVSIVQSPASAGAAPASGRRIADGSGAMLFRDADGRDSVTFPAPGADPAGNGTGVSPVAAVARQRTMGFAQAFTQRPAAISAVARFRPGGDEDDPAPAEGDDERDMDEIYETVVERLRRDLLAEREQLGDVLGGGR